MAVAPSMPFLGSTMLKYLVSLFFVVSLSFGADEGKKSPYVDDAYNKLVDSNASDAIKAYSDYLTKLDGANKKVLAGLEAVKKDLNDTSKNKNMTIQDRAKAIAEIEERIALVKRDGVGETVQGKVAAKADLVGEGGNKVEAAKIVGKWSNGSSVRWEFFADGTGKHFGAIEYSITWKQVDANTYEIGGGIVARNVVIVNSKSAEEVNKTNKVMLQRVK